MFGYDVSILNCEQYIRQQSKKPIEFNKNLDQTKYNCPIGYVWILFRGFSDCWYNYGTLPICSIDIQARPSHYTACKLVDISITTSVNHSIL